MDEPVTVKDAENAVKMPEIRGEVTFDHVNFSYDESKQILKDVSFTVKPGESVALVGPTGAGKSTIVNLISRFYNVNGGRVLIDGQDISQVSDVVDKVVEDISKVHDRLPEVRCVAGNRHDGTE